MNGTTLKALLRVRGLTQSDLAKMAGVSRQAVSHWFHQSDPNINVHSKTLQQIAASFGVTTDMLSRSLPILSDGDKRKTLETNILWDRLYPDLESFISGLFRGQQAALARLVQIYGLYTSEKIVGKIVWKKFHEYKLKMALAQRRQCEIIWNLHKNQD